MRPIIRNILLLLVMAALYAGSHMGLLFQRGSSAVREQRIPSAWTLPPLVLEIVAGEFKGIIADLIVLEAGSQLGTEVIKIAGGGYKVVPKEYDWDTIHTLFTNSQALDPRFQHTYVLAQGWLPWDPQMVEETQEILKVAAKSRPWDWQPLHMQGFNTYYFFDMPGEAGKIFLEAAKIPNAPPFLSIVGGRLALKGGETEAIIILLESVLVNKTEEDEGYQDIVYRLEALRGVRVIELAGLEFTKIFNRRPKTVAELVERNLLKKIPDNPYGDDYCIDAYGGVHFDNIDCFQNQ